MKKKLLTLGSIASFITPVIIVASCSTSGVDKTALNKEANALKAANFYYDGAIIDLAKGSSNYSDKAKVSGKSLSIGTTMIVSRIEVTTTKITITYTLKNGDVSSDSQTFEYNGFSNETILLKYINDNFKQDDAQKMVTAKLALLNANVAKWNKNNKESLKIQVKKAEISNVKWKDKKLSYQITFNTLFQGVKYERVEKVVGKEFVIANDVQGSKQVGLEVELYQSNSRLIGVDKATRTKTNKVSVNNLLATFLKGTDVDDFEADYKIVKGIKLNHTNDIHGRFDEDKYRFNKFIGLNNLAAYFKTHSPDLLLDGGDVYQGTGESNQDQGLRAAQIMSLIGYDGIGAGNHEFDFGREVLLERAKISPIYSANTTYETTTGSDVKDDLVLPGTRIKTIKGDLQVGLIPLTTQDTEFKANPANTTNMQWESIVETTKKEIAKLKALGVNLIVVYGHMGDEATSVITSVKLAQEVPEIDIIIDGHSHKKYETNRIVNGVYLAQTGKYTQHIGEIDFDFNRETGKITKFENKYIDFEAFKLIKGSLTRNAKVDKLVKGANDQFKDIKNEKAFDFPHTLATSVKVKGKGTRTVRTLETNAGNFFADAMQWFVEEQVKVKDSLPANTKVISIQNGGGVRASIEATTSDKVITQGDLLKISPFNNTLVALEITGAQLKQVFAISAKNWQDGPFLQVGSNLEVSYSLNAIAKDATDKTPLNANSVTSIKYEGVAVKDTDTFVMATNDFLKAGGDGYKLLKSLKEVINDDLLTTTLKKYGVFLQTASSGAKYTQDLYKKEYIKPSVATRIKITTLNAVAKAILAKFEAAPSVDPTSASSGSSS